MVRSSRTLAAVLGSLCLPAAHVVCGAMPVALLGAMVVGCGDESQPEYWVKKLDTPATRPAAIKRLTQFFEDGMTKSGNNRDAPEMKALMEKIVAPMAKAYVSGDLDEKTRVDLLKALANTRDPGAKDAIIKAISDFAAGKATVEEMKQSAMYIKQVKVKEAAPALLDAFSKLRAGDPKQAVVAAPVRDAMLAIADPAWKGKLLELINRPLDPKNQAEARNEVYWQTVAAEALGEIHAADAVRPLFKVVLNADKKDVAPTAVVALIKVGKEAVQPVTDILSGKDAEMVELAKAQSGGDTSKASAYIANAAVVLGSIGRAESQGPLVAALNKASVDPVRAVIGREMSKLPANPEAIRALETAYEKVAPSALLPSGDPARVVIAEAAGAFMDPSVVPWLLKQVREAKGESDEREAVQTSLLQTAIKLMKKDQVDQVKPVADSLKDEIIDKNIFKQASDLLTACGENVSCYLSKIEDPAVQDKSQQFVGIKSGYMLGILGNEGTKGEIVNRLPKIKNSAIRFVAVMAIDHLSPKGDVKLAGQMQQIIEADEARGDAQAIQANAPARQVVPRLRARAAP